MDRLKQLCLWAGIVLMLILALFCIVGSVMGAEWSKWFFNSLSGRGLLGCIGLLVLVGLFEFKNDCKTKWPLAVYPGVLLVLAAGFIHCTCTVFVGYIIGCIGVFGLLWTKWNRADVLSAVLLLLAGASLAGRWSEERSRREAVILATKVDVMSAPGAQAVEVFSLHAGAKVTLDRSSGDWVEIILPDRKSGWVKRQALEAI